MKMHSVIYRMLDDIKEELSSRLPPKEEHDVKGEVFIFTLHSLPIIGACLGSRRKTPLNYLWEENLHGTGGIENPIHMHA